MGTYSFPIEAGIAIRGQLKRAILAACVSLGVECSVSEDKGFLSSLYIFTLKGRIEDINSICSWIGRLEKDNNK